MDTSSFTPDAFHSFEQESVALAELYAQVVHALQDSPGQRLRASALLDELVEKLHTHFVHEEEGGYYSHVVNIAPWGTAAVAELKRQHAELSRAAARIATSVRSADESLQSWTAVGKEFADFLRRSAEHEMNEEHVIRETYLLDVATANEMPDVATRCLPQTALSARA